MSLVVIRSELFMKRHSDLLVSGMILSLDIGFLLGSSLPSIPKAFLHSSYGLLNFVGLLSIPFSYDQLKKYIDDLKLFSHCMQADYLHSFLRIAYVVSSIFLICLGSSAALLAMQHVSFSSLIYSFMKPLGMSSLAAALFLDILNFRLNQSTLSELQNRSEPEFQKIFAYYQDRSQSTLSEQEQKLAIRLKMAIDKDTWKVFYSRLSCHEILKNKPVLRQLAEKNILTQQFVAKSDIVLKVVGYFSRWISLFFPCSFYQAVLWTSISFFYTVQLAIQKFQQTKQQESLSKL